MSEWSDADARPLVFPLRDSEVIEATTPDDAEASGVFVWPEDPNEKTIVLFELSQREYTALASAIDVGRDIAFGQDSTRLWWLWIRNMVKVPAICEMMIDCITNDEDVKQALIDSLTSSPEFQEMIRQIAGRSTGGQIVGPVVPEGCDNSEVAGRVIQLVDILDVNNSDFLEIVEVGTNDEERVSLLLAAIPVLSESPVDEILNLFQGFLEDFTENYAAAVTLAWKSEVSEDLYCLAKQNEDCTLSYEEVFNYFNERAGSSLTIQSIVTNIVQFVINGDFGTDDLIASGMYAIQLAFVTAGRDFFGLNIPTIGAVVRDAGSSSAWEDWTECAPPVSGDWIILPDEDNPFTPDQPQGLITYQDEGMVQASSQLGTDGKYRIAMQNTTGCVTIAGGSFSEALSGGNCGCLGWVGVNVIFSPGAYFNHWTAEALVPFTVEIINT